MKQQQVKISLQGVEITFSEHTPRYTTPLHWSGESQVVLPPSSEILQTSLTDIVIRM